MAAYAALVSVMQIIEQIQFHPRPPISLHKEQTASLTEIITFLQDFLEGYSHVGYTEEADLVESRIAEAAYAAEDVIESYIVDQILGQASTSIEFFQGLQTVIEEMDSIKMEVVEIKEKMGVKGQLHIIRSGSFRSTSTAQKVNMVGFDDVLYEMLEKITRGRLVRRIIPIVGMGGIGKTTLARNVYVNPLVQQHFDVCAWSTISQNYNAREILREILAQVDKEYKEDRGNLSEDELGEQLYKYLIVRRYLIVMDDMWSIEAWDGVRIFFPDNENGSRIVITTRLSSLASQFNSSNGLHMKFLDEASSWNLFSKIVFGDEICPFELEDIGKKIVEGCRGLPLSIVVIGGLLSKSGRTREYWESIEGNLNSIVNSEDNESCLQILRMSYNNLPVYMKPCFLYTAIYPEDCQINVSLLIKLWVAEGFLKPIDEKSLEEVAEEYLEELVGRNLVLVEKRNNYGKIKTCKIHDLLRDVCLREVRRVQFLCASGEQSIPQGKNNSQRRQSMLSEEYPLESASLVRSLIGNMPKANYLSSNFRLLRVSVFKKSSSEYYEDIFGRLVNLRLLHLNAGFRPFFRIPSSVSFLWNLQTLVLHSLDYYEAFEIWKIPQLRHIMTYLGDLDAAYCLPDPYTETGQDEAVLGNLQTLFVVRNLCFGEGMLKRIPNIKKLKLFYNGISRRGGEGYYYRLNNLHRLHKLESLRLCSSYTLTHLVRELTLPHSLKQLTLEDTRLPWEDMKTKIGPLPLLQVLKLKPHSFSGSEWETVEGQFSSLKFLLIERCDLEYWITDNAHFPRLEHLVLRHLRRLREIPLSMGDIPTLRSIELEYCCDSAVDSARRILEEQEALGNEGLQLQVQQSIFGDEFVRSLMSLT